MRTLISRFSTLSVILFSLVFLAFASSPAFAQSDQGLASQQFGHGQPKTTRDLPSGQLKRSLESLPPKASAKALKWLQDIEFTGADLDLLKVDNEGGVFFEDTLLPNEGLGQQATSATTAEQAPSSTLANAFKLHSLPGAPNVVFIDFDGHVFSNTAWAKASYSAVPYDLDGNNATFNDTERGRIVDIWHRVAEDLSPFNIDVTTEEPDSFDRYTGRILITKDVDAGGKDMPSKGAGGVAYVGVFGISNYHTYYSPALVYYNNLGGGLETYVAEASSHEFGHNLGLSHDGKGGTSPTSYYSGHGSGLISWAPIMGNSYYNNVTEWSKGEYPDANQTQDDLAIIEGKLGLRPDDHGDAIDSGTNLVVGSNGSVVSSNPELDPDNILPENKGVINSRTDVDVFTFSAGEGPLSLTVRPAWDAFYRTTTKRGANLDIKLELRNSSGGLITTNDPSTDTSAAVSATVSAGTYHLIVSGEGAGDTSTGYSDYASLGQYFINGSMAVSGTDTTPPNPDPMNWTAAPEATGQTTISMTATVATDETSSVQYEFRCVAGGSGCTSSGWKSSNSYTASGLTAGTAYTFNVIARDQANNTTTTSPSMSATTQSAPDTTPPIPNPMSWASVPATTGQSSIAMTATVATDAVSSVQYKFQCVSGGAGCTDSAWQSSNSYTASGLTAGTTYTFNVVARDQANNTTTTSPSMSATTQSAPDTTPPNPNPMSWASVPAATGQNSIAMTATVATDAVSSVKYKFRCLSGGNGCVDSGWISTTSYTASGLAAGTAYSFEVLAQDVAGNTTSASPAGSATTAAPPIPPSSNISLNLSTSSNARRVSVKWSGANGNKSDIYRNGSKIKTTVNHGNWDDRKVLKGNTYRYRVCEQGSSIMCSGETSITL